MSIIKSAIQGGAHSNLPSAWKQSKQLGPKSNVPLAAGINSSLPPMPKLASDFGNYLNKLDAETRARLGDKLVESGGPDKMFGYYYSNFGNKGDEKVFAPGSKLERMLSRTTGESLFNTPNRNKMERLLSIRHEMHELDETAFSGNKHRASILDASSVRDATFYKRIGAHRNLAVLAKESNDTKEVNDKFGVKSYQYGLRKSTGESDLLKRLTGKQYGVDTFTEDDMKLLRAHGGNAPHLAKQGLPVYIAQPQKLKFREKFHDNPGKYVAMGATGLAGAAGLGALAYKLARR